MQCRRHLWRSTVYVRCGRPCHGVHRSIPDKWERRDSPTTTRDLPPTHNWRVRHFKTSLTNDVHRVCSNTQLQNITSSTAARLFPMSSAGNVYGLPVVCSSLNHDTGLPTTLGRRAFAVMGPTVWNSLPDDLRAQQNSDCFCQHLKTFLFSHY